MITKPFSMVILCGALCAEAWTPARAAVEDQLDKSSPEFHQWLSPENFGAKYGRAESDVEKTVNWLTASSFKVEGVSSDRMKIEFSGTAAQIHSTFKTELRNVSSKTGDHVANMSAPVIPVRGGLYLAVAPEDLAPVYYQLAKLQFETPYLLRTCKSNLGANISPACVFNELTTGDNSSPCIEGTSNCFVSPSSTMGIGVLQPSETVRDPAYSATLGYNQATGLGSLNVTNVLVNCFFL